jgi:hypothetical protein
MNLLEILTRVAERRGADSRMNDTTKRRYRNAVNEAHRQLLRMPGMEQMRLATVTFASVANQQRYAVPMHGVARINRITETTNDRKLEYRTPSWLDTVAPDPTTGTPYAWIPRGYSDCHTQPSDASAVYIVSTSASDVGVAYVEGIRTGGYYGTASVTMTGTTAVAVGSITDFITITKVYLASAARGTVTLHEDSGVGTEISRIAIGDLRAQFMTFQLYLTPSSVVTYYADILRSVPDLAQDADEPLLPEDFHDLLIDKAELKELRKQDDPNRYQMLVGDIKRGESELRSFVINHPDWMPQFGGHAAQFSTLGAQFPADTVITAADY